MGVRQHTTGRNTAGSLSWESSLVEFPPHHTMLWASFSGTADLEVRSLTLAGSGHFAILDGKKGWRRCDPLRVSKTSVVELSEKKKQMIALDEYLPTIVCAFFLG